MYCKQCSATECWAWSKRDSICMNCHDRNKYATNPEHRMKKILRAREGCKKYAEKIRIRRNKYHAVVKARAHKLIGNGKIECVNCGCNDPRFIEINHKIIGMNPRERKLGNAMCFLILNGKLSTKDLDLRCRVCNALHYLESKYGNIPIHVNWQPNNSNIVI